MYFQMASFISDTVLSFFFGFIMHIVVEMPAQQVQKMVLPQFRKQLKKSEPTE